MLSGLLPLGFCGLDVLDTISLGTNELTGPIPSCYFDSIPNIVTLDLLQNGLTSTIPIPSTTALANLFQFSVKLNQLTGTIPNGFETLSNLNYFDVSNNLLTGTMPKTLLEIGINSANPISVLVSVSNNLLTGNVPFETTQKLPPGISLTLYIDSNELTGDLSQLFFNLSNVLSLLDISTNQFTGRFLLPNVSTSLSSFTLTTLDLSTNFMTGKLIVH
jgi:hypothetical protein